MYLHLGNDILVLTRDIVGIFDIENSTIARSTKGFLAASERAGRVINVSTELPKSFVVCKAPERDTQARRRKPEKNDNTIIYISQISPSTLRKRAGFVDELSNV